MWKTIAVLSFERLDGVFTWKRQKEDNAICWACVFNDSSPLSMQRDRSDGIEEKTRTPDERRIIKKSGSRARAGARRKQKSRQWLLIERPTGKQWTTETRKGSRARITRLMFRRRLLCWHMRSIGWRRCLFLLSPSLVFFTIYTTIQ